MSNSDVDEFLAHYGIKGMHWGINKETPTGASRKTNKEAHKDADEFAKAKLFYGEGAGTRRKLIKAKVEAKAKRDPDYKKAFDHHLENQDFAKRASQARGERKRIDTTTTVTKTAKGVHRKLTGGFGSASLAASTIAGGIVLARQTGADKIILAQAKTAYSTVANSPITRQIKDQLFKN